MKVFRILHLPTAKYVSNEPTQTKRQQKIYLSQNWTYYWEDWLGGITLIRAKYHLLKPFNIHEFEIVEVED